VDGELLEELASLRVFEIEGDRLLVPHLVQEVGDRSARGLESVNMYSLRPNGICSAADRIPAARPDRVGPSSESIEEHQLPMIIPLVRSRTRMVDSTRAS